MDSLISLYSLNIHVLFFVNVKVNVTNVKVNDTNDMNVKVS